MYPRYYALRRVNPYRGVMQVVDVGEAVAHSFDGLTWHLRADDGYGWVRPVGVWEEGAGLRLGQASQAADLLVALETRPALPFPIFDTWERWLLEHDSGQPLALLDAVRDDALRGEERDVQWHPFALSYTGFQSAALACEPGAPQDRHKAWLSRMVNDRARPHAAAQWFKRGQDGVGHGADGERAGERIPAAWRNRELPASAFPELLVQENGNNPLEHSVIADYHAHLAPLLLFWPRLSEATRERLEAQACDVPQRLLRIHRLLPRIMNPARVTAALVAARLEQAQGKRDDDWI